MEVALDGGAEDVATDDEGGIEVVSDPADFARPSRTRSTRLA